MAVIFLLGFSVLSLTFIPGYSLDTPVTNQDIAKIASDYQVNWGELAPHLGLTLQQEQEIRHSFRQYRHQKRELLLKWRETKGIGATYRALITAAENVSNMQLADGLRNLLRTRVPTGV